MKLNSTNAIKLDFIISGGITKESNQQTINDIKNDNIKINKIIDIPNEYIYHSEAIGYLCLTLTPIICKISPDLCLVYGDRFESFAFATAATHLNKILLHIEAGDITEGGTYDDYIRHCITKMSHLFCTSTNKGLNIVSRLGEESWRAIQSGLLSYDDMKLIKNEDKDVVIKDLEINDNLPIVIATMHPIPGDLEKTKNESQEFFNALYTFSKSNNAHIFITSPNSDNGHQIIKDEIKNTLNKTTNIRFYESFGGFRYQTLMSLSANRSVIICGNSSSIIKEAPFYKAHSLNIGSRQNGREYASTQINCEANKPLILKTLETLIKYRNQECFNPYFMENSSQKIVDFIFKIFKNYSKNQILDKRWNDEFDKKFFKN